MQPSFSRYLVFCLACFALALALQWSPPAAGNVRRASIAPPRQAGFLQGPHAPTSRPLEPILHHNDNATIPTTIAIVGERHCGSNWLTDHLQACFPAHNVTPRFHRWKHWFQDERPDHQAVIVATFRNPYDWVMAMHLKYPYHAPAHFTSDWYDFVTTPWTLPDYQPPPGATQCQEHFSPTEVVPCLSEERNRTVFFEQVQKKIVVRATYELDQEGQPYPSIVDMRAAKNRHFINLGSKHLGHSFFPVQYEFHVEHGTERLVRQLEKVLQTQAACQPTEPQILTHRPYPKAFIAWMQEHVDWEAEALVGYEPDDYYLPP